MRTAELLAMLLNSHNAAHSSKKQKYKSVTALELMPDYLHERDREKEVMEKSIQQQAAEFEAFKSRYLAAENKARGK